MGRSGVGGQSGGHPGQTAHSSAGNLFRIHYTKLQEDYPEPDYISYTCKNCGHIQSLKAEELNSIVGNAFRMAYAAQLQPNFQQVIQLQDTEPQPIVWPKKIPSSKVSSGGVVTGVVGGGMMNVVGGGGKSGGGPQAPPPGSIPGLRGYTGTGTTGTVGGGGSSGSALSTPSSEESNSPTELNSAKRLGDKPPLVKRLALGNTPTDENGPSQGHMTLHHQSGPITEKNQLIVRDTTTNHKLIDIENNRLTDSPPSSEGKRRTGGSTTHPPPAPPERTDSLNNKPEEELKTAPWFQAGIPREITLEVLGHEPVGSFMVRESTTKPGCYALSLRVPQEFQPLGIAHYLIIRTNKGYKIKGFTKEFSTLTALITHHSVMPELLPCPLSLNRYNPSFAKSDSNKDFADIDSDPDYNTLADFRKMMADLNV